MKGIVTNKLQDSEQLVLKLLAMHRHIKPSGEAYFLAVSTKELVEDAKKLGKDFLRSSFYAPIQALREKDLINVKKRKIPCKGSFQKLSECKLKINKNGERELASESAQKNLLSSSWDPQI